MLIITCMRWYPKGTLAQHRDNIHWGDYVKQLLEDGIAHSKKVSEIRDFLNYPFVSIFQLMHILQGTDQGDHPPITPMRSGSSSQLHGDSWRIYEYITRHFIASISPVWYARK
jgi:DNA topoisomerase-3